MSTTDLLSHPLLAPLLSASDELVAPGQPFEVVEDTVLGERHLVFRNRPKSVREVLAEAAVYGDRDCLVFSDGRRITFAELEGQVASTAAWLRDEHGIGPGDRVAICATNSVGWILALWATTSLGAVVVAMNGWWTELEMRHALELAEPTVLLIDAKRGARLGATPGLTRLELDGVLDAMLAHRPVASLPEQPIDEDDPAILIFTSGTTGRPKAAVLTHRGVIGYSMLQNFIAARGAALAGRSGAVGRPPTRLAVFPLFHVSGIGTVVTAAITGGTTVWPLGKFDPGTVIDLTVREGINAWTGAVPHIFRLLDHPDLGRVDPAQLLSIGVGGSASTPEVIRRTDEQFPHLRGTFSSGYGSTEGGGLASFATNWMITAASDCVGPPLPTVEVRITDDDGTPVADGEEGDIWIRSALVMPGYWRHDEANAEVFAPGRWFRSGDYGRLEGGLLFIASRRRDLIIRGGENIYPFEIENRLEEHPDVIEVAVFGVDHEILGQEVKATIRVRDGANLTATDVQEYCAQTLASYKVPAHIELRTEPLARNATGKIMKHVLTGEAENTFVED